MLARARLLSLEVEDSRIGLLYRVHRKRKKCVKGDGRFLAGELSIFVGVFV